MASSTSPASLEAEIKGVDTSIKKVESQIVEVEEKLSKPGISEEEKQRLRKEKEHLRKKEEQLRKEEEQLREEKLLLLKEELRADSSSDVARCLIGDLAELERPISVAALRAFLEKPLGGKLPVDTALYNRLFADPANRRVQHLVERNPGAFGFCAVNYVAITTRYSNDAEGAQSFELSTIIDSILIRLHLWTGTGEEKARSCDMLVAVRELASKMGPVWPRIAFGDLPYLPCYAAAGGLLQFYVLLKEQHQHPVSISKCFNLCMDADRIEAVHATVNMFRLLCTLRPLLPPSLSA
ncbi:hypothetical protein GPECTOR_5g444 [Gonium pectorale]|uniref:Uncharacterized protein n=1 Tax=Gonium pectorale TaxID=33097 RepID=A0A150GX23_GONPE|nr:hypothetical protein GPECTOR_5g444 [Gonium pectorale]|eukprot:KXZ54364.1 hypothetical protein GPECTOR_5g444 [Gonium pectorale]